MFSSIDWMHPTGDLFILSLFAAAILLILLVRLRDRAIAVTSALYAAFVITTAVPDATIDAIPFMPGSSHGAFIKCAIFLLVLIGGFICLSRLLGAEMDGRHGRARWNAPVFSFFLTGFVMAITVSFFPSDAIRASMPLSATLFLLPWIRLGWFTAPLLFICFFTV